MASNNVINRIQRMSSNEVTPCTINTAVAYRYVLRVSSLRYPCLQELQDEVFPPSCHPGWAARGSKAQTRNDELHPSQGLVLVQEYRCGGENGALCIDV